MGIENVLLTNLLLNGVGWKYGRKSDNQRVLMWIQ